MLASLALIGLVAVAKAQTPGYPLEDKVIEL